VSAPRLPLLVLLLCGAGCGGGAADEPAADGPAARVTAQVAVAGLEDFPVVLTAMGRVAAAPGHVAELSAPAPSRVARIFVVTGQRVVAGQPLVALDATLFASEERRAEIARSTAQQAYDRARRLADGGILPRRDAEAAAAVLADATAALIAARQTRARAVLRSPIAGVVSSVDARLNAQADPAQVLVQVVDPRRLEVHLSVPPDQAGRLRPGQTMRLSAGPGSDIAGLGTAVITGVGAVLDTVTGSVDVRASVAGPPGRLFVNQDVMADIEIAIAARTVTVPAEAVVPGQDGSRVFVVDAAGVAHATPVGVGERRGDVVAITSGLRGGETVVAGGAYGVTDGARIVRGAP
jgi:RND family efflux transporter MFP subunit